MNSIVDNIDKFQPNLIGLSGFLGYPNGIPKHIIAKEHLLVCLHDISGSEIDKNQSLEMDFVLVIDRSASMRIDQKMAYVLATIEHIVKYLTENQRVCIITFNHKINVFTENFMSENPISDNYDNGFTTLTPQNKQKILDNLINIEAEGSTDIDDVFDKVFDLLNKRNKKLPATIYFLTDGFMNGKSPETKLLNCIHDRIDTNITLNTFGIGVDHDSTFLRKLAFLSGLGMYHYIESTDMIAPTIYKSLDYALNTVAIDIILTIKADPGIRIISNLSKFKCNELTRYKEYKIYLGSFSCKESKNILFGLSLNKIEGNSQNIELILTYKNAKTFKSSELISMTKICRGISEIGMYSPLVFSEQLRINICIIIENILNDITKSNNINNALSIIMKLIGDISKYNNELRSLEVIKRLLFYLEEIEVFFKFHHKLLNCGQHYINAYISSLYLERDVRIDLLMGSKKILELLSITTEKSKQKSSQSSFNYNNNDNSRIKEIKCNVLKYI